MGVVIESGDDSDCHWFGSRHDIRCRSQACCGNIKVRVVSLPSWEIFDRQPQAYRDSVLPPKITARLAVEAGVKLGWEHYVGLTGKILGMETFGASAPAPVLYEKFGFTSANIVAAATKMLSIRSEGEK